MCEACAADLDAGHKLPGRVALVASISLLYRRVLVVGLAHLVVQLRERERERDPRANKK